jgi:hypothetical protein
MLLRSEGAEKGRVMIEQNAEANPLWSRVVYLRAASCSLLYLSGAASDRLSLTQGAFFMLAATAEAAGKPATRSSLIAVHAEEFRGSIRNTYRQLLEPSRKYPNALGWLAAEPNPNDDREMFLRLTKRGRQVIERMLLALEPIHLERAA